MKINGRLVSKKFSFFPDLTEISIPVLKNKIKIFSFCEFIFMRAKILNKIVNVYKVKLFRKQITSLHKTLNYVIESKRIFFVNFCLFCVATKLKTILVHVITLISMYNFCALEIFNSSKEQSV